MHDKKAVDRPVSTEYSLVYFNLKGKTDADVKICPYICIEIFHFNTFNFLRYAQVKNQKTVKILDHEYETHKILPTFQEKVKLQW